MVSKFVVLKRFLLKSVSGLTDVSGDNVSSGAHSKDVYPGLFTARGVSPEILNCASINSLSTGQLFGWHFKWSFNDVFCHCSPNPSR